MFSLKKLLTIPVTAALLATPSLPLSAQQAGGLTEISQQSSYGITYGTMYSAFKKELKFEDGVDMVVNAAVELLGSAVNEAMRLNLDPRKYYEPVVGGIEESIKTRSKDVGLQKREEEILYEAVMDALRRKWEEILRTLPAVEPPAPPTPPEPEKPAVEPIAKVEAPKVEEPPKVQPKEPKVTAPKRQPSVDGYYLHTFLDLGGADEGRFQNLGSELQINPGTVWGYGLAVGRNTGDSTRVELEASFKGSKARANMAGVANDLKISYYTLMANAYKDFDVEANQDLDFFIGFGIGATVANLSGDVLNPAKFGHLPETGDIALAYQMVVGTAWRYANDLSLIIAYKLYGTEGFNHYNPDPIHLFEIGLRKEF